MVQEEDGTALRKTRHNSGVVIMSALAYVDTIRYRDERHDSGEARRTRRARDDVR